MNSYRVKTAFVLLCIIAAIAFPGKALGEAPAVSTATITSPSAPLPESPDFATRVLRDPWDMSQFTDISQLLNNGGQTDLLRKISVANGLFNAISSPRGDAQFYPLIAGYPLAMAAGKVGNVYPIPKSTYKCLYIAMQVNSTYSADGFQVFWFANEKYANPAGTYGVTTAIPLFPEAYGVMPPTPGYRLYSVNLSTATSLHTPWNNMPAVRALRIDPSVRPATAFSVDWIRLTDCNSVHADLTWTGGTTADTSIWLQPAGTGRNIRVATGIDGTSGSYSLDTQGLMPGSYYVGLGTATTCDATCTSQMNTSTPLVINQAPVATFTRPSFSSGPGKSWDFNTKSDVTALRNFKSTSFVGGNLHTVIASGPKPGGWDTQIILTTPTNPQILTNKARYLTFRMSSTNGRAPWQDPVEGMIARWVWTVKGPNKGTCWLVSQGIPYDIGYNTYSIDLWDSAKGKPVTRMGDCAGITTWQNSGAITLLRFDPSENITCTAVRKPFVYVYCGNYVQNLDYIRLTAMDQVTQGSIFPVEITLNRPSDQLSLAYYYTTALSDPTQAPAAGAIQTTGTDVTYNWDTTGVPAGTYYICATADDGINPVTSCSEANVAVVAPTP